MTQPEPRPPGLLSVEEVAHAIGRHPEVVRRQARAGRLPGEKIGRGWFFRPERMLAAGYQQFSSIVGEAETSSRHSAQAHALLKALSEAGLEALTLLDRDAIFQAIGRRLAEAGLRSAFFELTADGQALRVLHIELAGESEEQARLQVGAVSPLAQTPNLKRAIETRQASYLGDPEALARRTAQTMTSRSMGQVRQLAKAIGMEAVIAAPFITGDRVTGAIAVFGKGVRESDAPAVMAFANQTAGTLEAARLLKEARDTEEAMVHILASAIEMRDLSLAPVPGGPDLADALAGEVGLDRAARRRVRYGALLVNVGKIGLPDAVLRKRGRLDDEERAVLLTHTTLGADFVERFPLLRDIAPVLRSHHEAFNGEGYPAGLKGDKIPIETRVVSVVNAFQGLVRDQIRTSTLITAALDEVKRAAGTTFDPHIVDRFAALMERAPIEQPEWYAKLLRPDPPEEVPPGSAGPRDLLSVADSRELRIIYRVAQETRAVLDLNELLNHIVTIVREVMGYYLVSVVLPIPDHPGDLRIGAHSGYAADISGMIIPEGEGITGWAFRHAEPLIVSDVSVDPRYIGLDPNVRSELAFPLISRGKVIGVLNAESAAANAFTDSDVGLMSAVGSQLASALEVAQLHESVKQEAMHDPLTRLYNRRLLLQRTQEAIAHAGRHKEALTLVFIDVNQLKRINDTYGHLAGDALLREVASALTDAVRGEDVVARYGGDEFVVLLASSGRTSAVHVAERIRETISRHRFMAGGALLSIPGVSIGLASYPDDGDTPEALLSSADADLYRVKRGQAG